LQLDTSDGAVNSVSNIHHSVIVRSVTYCWNYVASVIDGNGVLVEWLWQGKTEVFGDGPVPVPFWYTTNPTCTVLSFNPGLRSEKPTTNRLSHYTVNEPVTLLLW